jgi:3-oxoacyl-[acyl-carrier protein] reductase
LPLTGKIAVVTGSSKGIGFAIAKEFAENNDAIVIVCSRTLEQAQIAASKIKGNVFAAELDVTDDLSVNKFMNRILFDHNRIDILVNNSGYQFDRNIWYKKFHEGTIEELQRIIEVDLKGSVRLSRAVIPIMMHTATTDCEKENEGGVIINISSTPAIAGYTEGSSYNITKAANIALTKCIAKEYAINNIRAYTLALGSIATLATIGSKTQEERYTAAQESSMKRWGKPEEVAKVAACIADNSFSFATGNTIVLDGGTVLL